MLVTKMKRVFSRNDEGSTLVTSLIVMLVLTVGGLALATIIANTTVSLAASGSRAKAYAAADAGIATQTALMESGAFACGSALNTYSGTGVQVNGAGSPTYDYSLRCEGGAVTLKTFSNVAGSKIGRLATFTYPVTSTPGNGGDITLFGTGSITFTQEVKPGSSDQRINIVLPNASFTCQTTVWGSVVARYDIKTNGGCTIEGSATSVAGVFNMTNGPDLIKGDGISGGTGTNRMDGTVTGKVHTNGSINFGWAGNTYPGSVIANGDVSLASTKISGSLTMPAGKSLSINSGSYGSIVRPATVPAASPLPTLPEWFEYKYSAADWSGYNVITLVNSGSGATSCNYYNSYPSAGWTDLNSITQNTVVDARACGTLSANAGIEPVITLKKNVLLLAKGFDLTKTTFKGASGLAEKPSLWIVKEDSTPSDHAPTCSPSGDTGLNHTVVDKTVRAMVYTPCTINVQGNTTWNGTLYGGGWNYGGGMTFSPDPLGLPGMPTSGGGSGAPSEGAPAPMTITLVSSRGTPWQSVP